MKVLFVSNYFNHHQKYVSNEMYLNCDDYKFIATSKMREERKKLGYSDSSLPPYVLDFSEDDRIKDIINISSGSDVTIVGSAPEQYLAAIQSKNKLVFRYSERIYKNKYQWYKWPFRLYTFYKNYGKFKNTYLLCSSAYTATDYAKHFTYINKTYKWGYFPETKRYDDLSELFNRKNPLKILWCGRFIDWKHAEHAIEVAFRLKNNGYNFKMDFIGNGALEEKLKRKVIDMNLNECISFLGAMSPEKVREQMENSGIYLFTSDRNEGWGAVLNESMNSGCAVVASHAIGAVPYLLKDRENGFIYNSGDIDMLYEKVKYLLENPNEQRRLGQMAYQTIVDEWNAEVAVKRLLILAEHILNGEKIPDLFSSGPCSKAEIIKDNWYGENK